MKSRTLPRRLLLFIALLLLLGIGLHLAAVQGLRWAAQRFVTDAAGNGLFIGPVRLNLFAGALEIADLQLGQRPDSPLRARRLVVGLDWLPLLQHRLQVNRVELQRPRILIEQLADGSWRLPLALPATDGPAGQGDDPAASPWRLLLRQLRLSDASLTLRTPRGEQQLSLTRVRLSNLDTAGDAASLLVEGALAGAPLKLDARLQPQPFALAAQLRLQRLDLKTLRVLADGLPQLAGQLDYNGRLQLDDDRLALAGGLLIDRLAVKRDPLTLGLGQLDINAMRLSLPLADPLAARLTLGGGLKLKGLAFSQADQQLKLQGLALSGKARLSARRVELPAASGLALSGLDWQQGDQAAGLQTLNLNLPGSLQLDLPADGEPLLRLAERAELRLQQGRFQQATQRLTLAAGELQLRADGPLSAIGLFSHGALSGLAVQAEQLPERRLRIGRLSWERAHYQQALNLEGLQVAGLALLPAAGEQPLATLAEARLDRLSADSARADVGQLMLSGLQTALHNQPDGGWQLPWQAPPASDESGSDYMWRLAGLTLEQGRIRLRDETVQPAFVTDMQIESLSLGALDSSKPDADSQFALRAKPGKYASLTLSGQLRPLADKLRVKLDGRLEDLDLAALDGYVQRDFQHRMLRGELDNAIRLELNGRQLKMQNKLEIADLEVESLNPEQAADKAGNKDAPPPLGLAASLLRDSDGRIRLEVPIEGDLDDPDFAVRGVLDKALLAAMQVGVAVAIQPVGSLLLVGKLLSSAAQVRFPNIGYLPGSAELAPKQADYLQQLADKLKQRPGLRLRLCGLASLAELQPAKPKPQKLVKPEALKVQAMALAEQRAKAALEWLSGQGGADPAQLKLCTPRLQEGPDIKPGVEVALW